MNYTEVQVRPENEQHPRASFWAQSGISIWQWVPAGVVRRLTS